MDKCVFRPVRPSDLQQVCQFPQNEMELFSSFPSATFPLSVEQLEKVIEERHASSVLELNNEVVGFSNLYNLVAGESVFIGNVFISPRYRQQGLGELLIRSMMQLAFENYAVHKTRVSCFQFNEKAMRLYERIGFERYDRETRVDPHGNEVELLHMEYTERNR